jgi:hypothetical protein
LLRNAEYVSTNSSKDKMDEEYDSIVKSAEEIENIRQKLHSDLIEVRTKLREFEEKYKTTLTEREESASGPLLPMIVSTRVGAAILVEEYIDIRENRRFGKYKLYNRFR